MRQKNKDVDLVKKVNFVLAGTQKGGTTALYSYLKQHNNIQMASVKEVHFFDNEANFKDTIDYSKYHLYFNENEKKEILGEATPIYMYWNQSVERIFNYNKEIKFIIILRNPIDRAYSHWNMERDRNADTMSFHYAIHNEKKRCEETLPFQHRVYSYIDRGFYTKQLKKIWEFFPKKQVLILKNTDLQDRPNETLLKVTNFLNIENFNIVEKRNIHSRNYISKMDVKDREYLKNIFVNEIKELEVLLNWDCSDWLD
jgi:hypothetical protein